MMCTKFLRHFIHLACASNPFDPRSSKHESKGVVANARDPQSILVILASDSESNSANEHVNLKSRAATLHRLYRVSCVNSASPSDAVEAAGVHHEAIGITGSSRHNDNLRVSHQLGSLWNKVRAIRA
jgi:hypothetical protein